MTLPHPTVERVQVEGDKFDRENQLVEEALAQLLRAFPHNTENSQVLIKALVLNNLYKTRIRDIDMETVAAHITGLDIDQHLARGSLHAVDLIMNIGGIDRPFSFATKFCSWHNPTAYPIYDGNADEALWAYRNQDHFANFRRQDFDSYEKYVTVVSTFRSFYRLDSFTFKRLDHFLWHIGGQLLAEKSLRKAAEAGA